MCGRPSNGGLAQVKPSLPWESSFPCNIFGMATSPIKKVTGGWKRVYHSVGACRNLHLRWPFAKDHGLHFVKMIRMQVFNTARRVSFSPTNWMIHSWLRMHCVRSVVPIFCEAIFKKRRFVSRKVIFYIRSRTIQRNLLWQLPIRHWLLGIKAILTGRMKFWKIIYIFSMNLTIYER